jgi:hypothetical protein
MGIEITPELGAAEQEALRSALDRAGVSIEQRSRGHDSAWRRAASREAVDNEPVPPTSKLPYARSPRSTRGATKA